MATRNLQRGSVLIISLIFLSIMATLAATSMQATTTNERLAGNIRDRSAAFQAAEATLSEAERQLPAITSAFTVGADGITPTVAGQYPAILTVNGVEIDSWRFVDENSNASGTPLWEDNNAVTKYQTADSYLDKVLARAPAYIIEQIKSSDKSNPPVVRTYYRITAKAVGLTENSEVVLQTTFKKL